ncbi:hypothetical protein [Maioricimonas sp. JC845]|uniref:hypothetical protein n=1 Tax=Maioricimonas sp. JC845 TaxID=3232138 RepID=UPI003457F61B
MTTRDASTVVLQLKFERTELELLNRTVTHCLCLASDRDLLPDEPRGQHSRRVPSTCGARRDAFFWDSWDWKLRGEDDLRRFFEIAERIGGCLQDLAETEAADLLPGSVDEIVGRRTRLNLPDYWLFVVHHLGWTEQLPYECRTDWMRGSSFTDQPFSMTSLLPVNVVQASIDALTVLIDAVPHAVWDRRARGYVLHSPSPVRHKGDLERSTSAPARPPWADRKNTREPPVDTTVGQPSSSSPKTNERPPRSRERRVRKRADRAANIEALKKELIEHIRAARDHAQSAVDFGREAELLPRPSRRELAERVGITESAASRCFSDPAATELNLLWNTADDLKAVMTFVRH